MDPIAEFIDGIIKAIVDTREETQDDYALAGPKK